MDNEHGQEVTPPSVLNTFVRAGLAPGSVVFGGASALRLGCWTAAEVGRLNGLPVDRVVLAYERQGCVVVEVCPLPRDVLRVPRALLGRLYAAVALLLAARDPLVGFL
jgi:hypothetical protein